MSADVLPGTKELLGEVRRTVVASFMAIDAAQAALVAGDLAEVVVQAERIGLLADDLHALCEAVPFALQRSHDLGLRRRIGGVTHLPR